MRALWGMTPSFRKKIESHFIAFLGSLGQWEKACRRIWTDLDVQWVWQATKVGTFSEAVFASILIYYKLKKAHFEVPDIFSAEFGKQTDIFL